MDSPLKMISEAKEGEVSTLHIEASGPELGRWYCLRWVREPCLERRLENENRNRAQRKKKKRQTPPNLPSTNLSNTDPNQILHPPRQPEKPRFREILFQPMKQLRRYNNRRAPWYHPFPSPHSSPYFRKITMFSSGTTLCWRRLALGCVLMPSHITSIRYGKVSTSLHVLGTAGSGIVAPSPNLSSARMGGLAGGGKLLLSRPWHWVDLPESDMVQLLRRP